ncbi:uncharacterized protein LOC123371222, partial [Mauremys mutica]|uniref:uncharacterized protein LOC123371222 n=1 Tax=Mauremys mutica TaxID=74926 RepID=UPI001D15F4A9
RRTALVARELARFNIDIAALCETRLANEGQLTEIGGGYTFFWCGRSSDERRESGVGFAVKNQLVRKFASLPKGVNDRLMTLHLPLPRGKQAILISAYAPTMTNPDEVKDKFYEDLDALLSSVKRTDRLILLGDFNARVGSDHSAWDGVIGKNGIGKCNSNGLLLLKTCVAHDLIITNTIFRLPTRKKTSWMHPHSKHWHLIDYVIVRRKDRQDVRVTKAMPSADCWTDHRLIISKLSLYIKPKRRPQGNRAVVKKINVSKLRNPNTAALLAEDLDNQLLELQLEENAEKDWERFRNIVHSSALKVLGPSHRKQQDWFDENDEEIKALLAEKHRLYRAKRKGNRKVCDNHRGISLLSSAGKILARVLLNRLIDHLEQGLLPETQCGFRKERGTVDMIFAVRQLQEKCQEQNRELYTIFVDLTKAFDTVSREGLWRIMSKFGCPDRFILMVRQFHDGMTARVLDDGEASEAFPVTNGVKQGCVLAPTLFSMMFSAMLSDAFQNSSLGVSLRYRTDGKLFNLRRLQAVTKIKETAVDQFTYLGSTLSRAVTIDIEVNCRIAKASSAFGGLLTNVWDRCGISLATKLKVYQAVVLTTLMYASETWTVYRRHARQLNHFHTTCLRRLLRIRWQDKVPDTEVLSRAGLPSVYTLLMKAQTRWAGHVVRMPDHRIPKQLFYGELSQGKRSHGGQKKRYKDT